jgi:hypothetical protein
MKPIAKALPFRPVTTMLLQVTPTLPLGEPGLGSMSSVFTASACHHVFVCFTCGDTGSLWRRPRKRKYPLANDLIVSRYGPHRTPDRGRVVMRA